MSVNFVETTDYRVPEAQDAELKLYYWVRSFSFPGSTPVCGVFFFPGRTCVIICIRLSCKKNTPHTGGDPGELNERTHCWNEKKVWAPFQHVNVLFPIDMNGHCLCRSALIHCCKRVNCPNGVQWDFT